MTSANMAVVHCRVSEEGKMIMRLRISVDMNSSAGREVISGNRNDVIKCITGPVPRRERRIGPSLTKDLD